MDFYKYKKYKNKYLKLKYKLGSSNIQTGGTITDLQLFNITTSFQITQNTIDRFSPVLQPFIKPGMKVAIFGGSKLSGIGTLSENDIVLINIDKDANPTLNLDIQYPSQFDKLENMFDIVVTERIESYVFADPNVYKSAYKILKQDGLLIAGMYFNIDVNLNKITPETRSVSSKYNQIINNERGTPGINELIRYLEPNLSKLFIGFTWYDATDILQLVTSQLLIHNRIQNNGFKLLGKDEQIIALPDSNLTSAKQSYDNIIKEPNYCFLTETTTLKIKDSKPFIYCVYQKITNFIEHQDFLYNFYKELTRTKDYYDYMSMGNNCEYGFSKCTREEKIEYYKKAFELAESETHKKIIKDRLLRFGVTI